jgi:serine/threonine protein kinase
MRNPTDPNYRPYSRELSINIGIKEYVKSDPIELPATVISRDRTDEKELYTFLDPTTKEFLYGIPIRKLGSGGYGDVFLYQTEGNVRVPSTMYAIKMLSLVEKRYDNAESSTIKEVSILRRLRHPLIVEILGLAIPAPPYTSKTEDIEIGLVMPVYDGSLRSYRSNNSSNLLKLKYCYQATAAVAYLHSRDVIHRDLKPDNILYDKVKDQIAVTDFGISRALGCPYSGGFTREVFTMWYRPPELFADEDYYYPGDIWSLGLIMYYIITGRDLFGEAGNAGDMIQMMLRLFQDLQRDPGSSIQDDSFIRAKLESASTDYTPSVTHRYLRSGTLTDKLQLLDTPGAIRWSTLLLPLLQLSPIKRITAADLLQNPVFDPVRESRFESFYISCLDNLYLREQPLTEQNDILNTYQNQPNINFQMRSILVNWLFEVWRMFKLRRETYFMTVYLLDTYLPPNISKANLQLFGLACLNLASIYLEIYHAEIKDYVYISDNAYTKVQLATETLQLLHRAGYDMVSATSMDFLRELIKEVKIEKNGEETSEETKGETKGETNGDDDATSFYRHAQAILYFTCLVNYKHNYSASEWALWSIYQATLYWNHTYASVGKKARVEYPYSHLLSVDDMVPFARLMPRVVTSLNATDKFFKTQREGNVDLLDIRKVLIELSGTKGR